MLSTGCANTSAALPSGLPSSRTLSSSGVTSSSFFLLPISRVMKDTAFTPFLKSFGACSIDAVVSIVLVRLTGAWRAGAELSSFMALSSLFFASRSAVVGLALPLDRAMGVFVRLAICYIQTHSLISTRPLRHAFIVCTGSRVPAYLRQRIDRRRSSSTICLSHPSTPFPMSLLAPPRPT